MTRARSCGRCDDRSANRLGRFRRDARRHAGASSRRVAGFFGFGADAEAGSTKSPRGPLMTRYSKALEYDYSPTFARELIAEAIGACAPTSTARLPCSRSAAEKSPLLARALARAEGGLNVPNSANPDRRRSRRVPPASRRRAPFVDGRISNPHNNAKQNEQLHEPAAYQKSSQVLLQALDAQRGVPRFRLPGR